MEMMQILSIVNLRLPSSLRGEGQNLASFLLSETTAELEGALPVCRLLLLLFPWPTPAADPAPVRVLPSPRLNGTRTSRSHSTGITWGVAPHQKDFAPCVPEPAEGSTPCNGLQQTLEGSSERIGGDLSMLGRVWMLLVPLPWWLHEIAGCSLASPSDSWHGWNLLFDVTTLRGHFQKKKPHRQVLGPSPG